MKLQSRISAINLPQLRCAVVAADEGSFRRAAEVLLVRQSTLSRGIRQLEHLIGMSIFDRSSGGVTATPSGRGFLRHARSILEQIDSLITTADRTSRGEAGRLSIGFHTSLSAGNLRATLLDFRQRVPSIELELVEMSRTRLVMTALRSGTMDVAIATGETTQRDGGTVPLWSERILLALTEGHPLANGGTIYWTDLRGETVLLSQRDQGREFEDILISKLVSSEDRPRIKRHDVSRDTLKSLISLGFGIGLVTESDIGCSVSGLIYRELRDGTGPCRIGYSAHWRAENDNPALASFLVLLRERYPAILTFKIRLEQLLGPDARPATAKLLRAGIGRGKRGEGVIAFRILDSRQTTAGSERKARRSSTCSVASFTPGAKKKALQSVKPRK